MPTLSQAGKVSCRIEENYYANAKEAVAL